MPFAFSECPPVSGSLIFHAPNLRKPDIPGSTFLEQVVGRLWKPRMAELWKAEKLVYKQKVEHDAYFCPASMRRYLRSSKVCSGVFILTKVVAIPVLPLRPVRPI